MLTFHPLSLADKPWIDRFVRQEDSRSADFNFGNMFLWDHVYHQEVADSERYCITLCRPDGDPLFPIPIGCGDIVPPIEELLEYAAAGGFPLELVGVEERHIPLLEQGFPGCFEIAEDRVYMDYVYDAQRLISLSGKKLHGKRNHINRFCAEHEWSFRLLRPEDRDVCMSLMESWMEVTDDPLCSIAEERDAIELAFRFYDALELFGGLLTADGEVVGFSIGERSSRDTFNVHFEKARGDINGAYPMVNRELVRMVCERWPRIRYINREDDMGLENLAKSKMSYDPAILLRKYTALWKGET